MGDGSVIGWTSSLLSRYGGLAHGVTGCGVNMSLTVGADVAGTVARRGAVCDELGLSSGRLTVGEQVQGANIAIVMGDRVGCGGSDSETRIANVDGLVTDEPGVPLMVMSADCCLVVVYDPERHAVGVVHAGWRGTAAGVTQALLRHMGLVYECQAVSLLAAVSPCAGVCCYEVGEDVVSSLGVAGQNTERVVDIRDGSMFLDLAKANAIQLLAGGVGSDRIDVAGMCTICGDGFYSHRRSPGEGRFGLIAGIR